MLAVRWLLRTPTTMFRCLSSKATSSLRSKSLWPARAAGGGSETEKLSLPGRT
jgi:hypothetical protein